MPANTACHMNFTTFSTCVYNKHANQKAWDMTFTKFSTCVYNLDANKMCPILLMKITNFWNMTTTRNFAVKTRWGNYNKTTSTLHYHPKQLNTIETYLFYLLPQDTLVEIDILTSWIEHRKKLKAVITKINPLCNPILFAIPQELRVPYNKFSVYIRWYNECYYTWAHKHVRTNTR